MQVLRYGIGQFYKRHTDSLENDSPRIATLLIYLADPEEGGETAFPEGSAWSHPGLADVFDPELSECAKGHVAFKPRRGDGLLFWSIHPDGKTEDPASLHEGCPVVKGAKWTTTVWVHSMPFRPEDQILTEGGKVSFKRDAEVFSDPGLCRDDEGSCLEWARNGECLKNKEFMESRCRAACNVCKLCEGRGGGGEEVTSDCYWKNRKDQGYLVFSQSELDFRRT
jgi:prolyl 4-hydroxylase